MKIHGSPSDDKRAELNMTSMIDVVFLLLIFFVLTFKIVAQEGDFNIRMPLADNASGPPPDPTDLPFKLRLHADGNGQLSDIVLNEGLSFGTDWEKLRRYIIERVGGAAPQGAGAGEGPEIEIDLDYNLRYEHVIEAITATTGQKRGNEVIRLIERIKFAPPRRN